MACLQVAERKKQRETSTNMKKAVLSKSRIRGTSESGSCPFQRTYKMTNNSHMRAEETHKCGEHELY
ncbi:hypothetical protein J6590_081806 [Homalodisca vitripennis]|nr:hypothetical protein J6590_081806 [Homalodisca vitripennis]